MSLGIHFFAQTFQPMGDMITDAIMYHVKIPRCYRYFLSTTNGGTLYEKMSFVRPNERNVPIHVLLGVTGTRGCNLLLHYLFIKDIPNLTDSSFTYLGIAKNDRDIFLLCCKGPNHGKVFFWPGGCVRMEGSREQRNPDPSELTLVAPSFNAFMASIQCDETSSSDEKNT